MHTSYEAAVAEPADAVWASLTDVDSVLAALPGAALAREGDVVTGSLKCRFGSSQITYRLTARADTGDPGFHNAVLAVTGKEARGSGTLGATLTVAVRADGDGSRIEVGGDVEATGRAEGAKDNAWNRVIESLVKAVVPQPTPEPVAPPPAPTRPPLAVAPQPAAPSQARPGAVPPALIATVAVVLLLLLGLRRRRGRTRK